MIKENRTGHNTLCGFAMDHGSHQREPKLSKNGVMCYGTDGIEIPEDINILHRYRIFPATE